MLENAKNKLTPKSFQYVAPTTVSETISYLQKLGPDARILAGGQRLIPLMKLRLASPQYLIDINKVSELAYIQESDGWLLIGATTRHHALQTSDIIKQKVPIMSDTAAWIGDPQVRNNGTVGGSLAHSDPAGDWGATILALNARLKASGPDGDRVIYSDDFFVDTLTSALKSDEILTEIQVPIPKGQSGGAYAKFERKSGDFATVGVAAQLGLNAKGVCESVGIGLTALGPKSMRARRAEAALLDQVVNEKAIEDVAEVVAKESTPADDPLRGSAEYKKAMAKVFARRALNLALRRATGGTGQ
jgi:carbon-monoxide dehydrogenase medium subunit